MLDKNGKRVPLNYTRTTFQRTSDAKFFHGWIRQIQPECLTAVMVGDQPFAPGDQFRFRIFSDLQDAYLDAEFCREQAAISPNPNYPMPYAVLAKTREYVFIIRSEIRLEPSKEQARLYPSGIVASVVDADGQQGAGLLVVNISKQGLCVSGRTEHPKHTRLKIELNVLGEPIVATVEVRYCVKDRSFPGQHRIGLQIVEMDRVSGGRWRQLNADMIRQSFEAFLSASRAA